MEVIGTLGGGAPLFKRLMTSSTITAGTQVLGAGVASSEAGSIIPGTASDVMGVGEQAGIAHDTSGTFSATAATEDSAFSAVCISPDAIVRAKMNSGATADTALPITDTVTTADSGGATLTGITTLDDSLVWGYSGSNPGIYRRADDTSGSCSVNFPDGTNVGDVYLIAQGFPMVGMDLYFDLTSDFTQVNATTAVTDSNNYVCIDVETRDASDDGESNSFYHLIQINHALLGGTSRGV